MKRACNSCNREAVSACLCTDPPTLLCNVHNHNRLSSTMHKQVNIYSKISSDSCHMAQSICSSVLTQIKTAQKSYFEFFTKLISLIKEKSRTLMDECRIKTCQIQKMISYLNHYDYIYTNMGMSQEEQELYSLLISGELDSLKFPDFDEIIDSLKSSFQNKSKNSKRKSNLENKKVNSGLSNNKLMLPMPYQNSVFLFDVDKLKEDSLTFEKQDFPCGYGFSLLPGNELMIYGGAINMESRKPLKFLMSLESILINPYTKTIKKLKDGVTKSDTGNGAYLDGYIYVFGGFDRFCKGLDSAMKYDCSNNIWMSICKLPEPFGGSSSATFNKDIFVCNKRSEIIHIYSVLSNSYKESMKFKIGYKVFLALKNRFFLIIGDDMLMYESEWLTLGKIESEINPMICPYIERNGFIYFMTGKFNFTNGDLTNFKILRLNISSFALELVTDRIVIN